MSYFFLSGGTLANSSCVVSPSCSSTSSSSFSSTCSLWPLGPLLAIPSQFRGWIGSMHVSEACHLSHFDWLHGFQTSRYPPHCPVLVRPRVRKTCCRNRSARWIWNHVQLLSSRSCQTFPAPSPSLWLPQKRNFFKVPKAVITLPNPQPHDLSQKSFEHQRIFEHFLYLDGIHTHTCHTHAHTYIYI